MTKNDNSTTYGISMLTPINSVNIGQSGITYNPNTQIWTNGKTMDYGKKYYLWFKRTTQTPNTWQKSQFYIDFKQWIFKNGSTLTFIIKDNANVIPITSTTLP